jgi:integrase
VTLSSILRSAVDDEIIVKNPAAGVKRLRTDGQVKATETIHRALTPEEQKIFLEESKNDWLAEFYAFSLCTGMRIGEIGALLWSDIDYVNEVIHVTKTLSPNMKDANGEYLVSSPKSKTSVRDIPLNDLIRATLKRQKEKMMMVYGDQSLSDKIFRGGYGAPMSSANVNGSIAVVLGRLEAKKICIERFTHHAFRDTFATRYIEAGGNMQTLKQILGHASLAMTADLYAHVLPNTKKEEMDQIQSAFTGVAGL